MTYNEATLYAATGSTLMLPGWIGYFKWDYAINKMIFVNGDYRLENLEQVKDRTDWIVII